MIVGGVGQLAQIHERTGVHRPRATLATTGARPIVRSFNYAKVPNLNFSTTSQERLPTSVPTKWEICLSNVYFFFLCVCLHYRKLRVGATSLERLQEESIRASYRNRWAKRPELCKLVLRKGDVWNRASNKASSKAWLCVRITPSCSSRYLKDAKRINKTNAHEGREAQVSEVECATDPERKQKYANDRNNSKELRNGQRTNTILSNLLIFEIE